MKREPGPKRNTRAKRTARDDGHSATRRPFGAASLGGAFRSPQIEPPPPRPDPLSALVPILEQAARAVADKTSTSSRRRAELERLMIVAYTENPGHPSAPLPHDLRAHAAIKAALIMQAGLDTAERSGSDCAMNDKSTTTPMRESAE